MVRLIQSHPIIILILMQLSLVTSDSHIKTHWDVNYFSVMELIRLFRPLLSKHNGRIINIGSASAISPVPGGGTYSTTKAALRSASKVDLVEISRVLGVVDNDTSQILASEMRPLKISVSHVEPGFISTPMVENAKMYVELKDRRDSILYQSDITTEDYKLFSRQDKK